MSKAPVNERYVIFLPPKYFEKRFFESVYCKIIKELEIKGVSVFNIEKCIDFIKATPDLNLLFDDSPFPNTHQLYIHLFNSKYYSDNIYNKIKIERERDMLFLLAGKLGVKKIEYSTEITEITLTKVQTGVTVKSIDNSFNFTKSIETKQGICGEELYENRGAPVYLKFNSLEEVEANIKERLGSMKSNIFSFEFYKQNPKLESFVYKRFEFKMSKLKYSIESDDISDISFAVKSCFMDWGVSLSIDKNTSKTEKIEYSLEFFSDEELNLVYNKIKFEKDREIFDPFYSIRETYEAHNDKEVAVHIICEYVMIQASKCYYKHIESGQELVDTFSKLLRNYIKENQGKPTAFETICHDFRSTSQIKNWLYINLIKSDNCEIIYSNPCPTPNSNYELSNVEPINTDAIKRFLCTSTPPNQPANLVTNQASLANINDTDSVLPSETSNEPKDIKVQLQNPIYRDDWILRKVFANDSVGLMADEPKIAETFTNN